MSILNVRRVSQGFFLLLFLWFCVVAALGDAWWQLRGWPVNWFLELDPLTGLGTLLSTHTLYNGLFWGLVPVILTILLGRFFCGWVCPFGTLHQFVGYLGRRRKAFTEKRMANRYSRWQAVKYYILFWMLGAAMADLLVFLSGISWNDPQFGWMTAALFLIGSLLAVLFHTLYQEQKRFDALIFPVFWVILFVLALKTTRIFQSSLQTGLLDPIPLFHRSVNLILLPLVDPGRHTLSAAFRHYQGAWLIGTIFFTAVFLNLKSPRFYCRYVCPLGALFGLFARYSLGRIGKTQSPCAACNMCDADCEGACSPATSIVWGECVLCLNCLGACTTRQLAYRVRPSEGGEILLPDFGRRGFVFSMVSGVAAVPLLRAGGGLSHGWNPALVRPPGALPEAAFLSRCIKCGQCMRICPTGVIQPAGLEAGLEGVWTPVLDFRMGTSGCHHTCIACGHLCPTAAIRALSFDERLGRNAYAKDGPVRIGTAFIDRGRCLPWAMDKPCIVCQENCPVSPKAIFTREYFSRLRFSESLKIKKAGPLYVEFDGERLPPGQLETGDYYCILRGTGDADPRRILKNGADRIEIYPQNPWKKPPAPENRVEIRIRLQQPYVDIDRCIGCGVCEHECPVSGKRAIRVSAENESRHPKHALTFAGTHDTHAFRKG